MNEIKQKARQIDELLHQLQNHSIETEQCFEHLKKWPALLKAAIEVETDEKTNQQRFFAPSIVDLMLMHYDQLEEEVYCLLLDRIFENVDLARSSVTGDASARDTFLLMSFYNPNLRLTKAQKAFAVQEAMLRPDTALYKKEMHQYQTQLRQERKKCGNPQFELEVDGKRRTVTATDFLLRLKAVSCIQPHGADEFDLRYRILISDAYTDREKYDLIYAFYKDQKDYENYLRVFDHWEKMHLDQEIQTQSERELIQKLHQWRPASWETTEPIIPKEKRKQI